MKTNYQSTLCDCCGKTKIQISDNRFVRGCLQSFYVCYDCSHLDDKNFFKTMRKTEKRQSKDLN